MLALDFIAMQLIVRRTKKSNIKCNPDKCFQFIRVKISINKKHLAENFGYKLQFTSFQKFSI